MNHTRDATPVQRVTAGAQHISLQGQRRILTCGQLLENEKRVLVGADEVTGFQLVHVYQARHRQVDRLRRHTQREADTRSEKGHDQMSVMCGRKSETDRETGSTRRARRQPSLTLFVIRSCEFARARQPRFGRDGV
jgi:hypothetical protein